MKPHSRNYIIYVGWQVLDYYTGDCYENYGGKNDVKCNHADTATCSCKVITMSGTRNVPHNSSIKDITVWGAHTAYKNGTAILKDYTTTFNP